MSAASARSRGLMPSLVGWHVGLGEVAGRLFVLHLLWVAGVLAGGVVLGAGPATLALNAVLRRDLMNEALEARNLRVARRPGLWAEFWGAWRAEFWRAQAIALILAAGWGLLAVDRAALGAGIGPSTPWLSGVAVVLGVVWAALTLAAWPVAAHFDEPLRRTARLVLVLLLSRPAHAVGVLAVGGSWLWLWTAWPGLVAVFGLALPAWCVSWLVWRSGALPLPTSEPLRPDPLG